MHDISAYSRYLFSRPILRSAFTVGLLLGGVWLSANRAFARAHKEPSQHAKRLRGRVVLKTFPVAPSGDLRYELSLAACARSECPFQVRLIEGAKVYGTLNLDWGSVPERPGKTPVDGSLGAGDPLQKEWEGLAWETGDDVSVTARSISLTPELNGLLIDQRSGFQSVKRRHYLFAAIGRKLTRAWTGSEEENERATVSMVEISEPLSDGSRRFIYFSKLWYFLFPPEDGQDFTEDDVDSIEFAIYKWNSRKNVIERASATDSSSPFVALIAGAYDTMADARKALKQNYDCLGGYFLVLNTDSLPQSLMLKGKFVIAALSAKVPLAERVVKEIKQCAPAVNIQLLKFQPSR